MWRMPKPKLLWWMRSQKRWRSDGKNSWQNLKVASNKGGVFGGLWRFFIFFNHCFAICNCRTCPFLLVSLDLWGGAKCWKSLYVGNLLMPKMAFQELIGKNISTEVGLVNGMRTVSMDGVSCGCGGTHVEGSGEIKEVTIKKIQAKQGNVRVSYALWGGWWPATHEKRMRLRQRRHERKSMWCELKGVRKNDGKFLQPPKFDIINPWIMERLELESFPILSPFGQILQGFSLLSIAPGLWCSTAGVFADRCGCVLWCNMSTCTKTDFCRWFGGWLGGLGGRGRGRFLGFLMFFLEKIWAQFLFQSRKLSKSAWVLFT